MPATNNAITLNPVADVKPTDITSPSPKQVDVPTVENKASQITINQAVPMTYTPFDVDSGELLTNESFNRNVETLKVSGNARIEEIYTALRGLADSINTNNTQNIAEISAKLKALAENANAQFDLLAKSEADQSRDTAAAINRVKGDLLSAMDTVVNRLVSNTDRLDAVELLATGNSQKILEDFQSVKNIIDTFRLSENGKDFDLFTEIEENKKRLNESRVLHQFAMTVQPINGIINLNTRALGIGEFVNASDFIVNANIFNDPTLQVSVINQTKDGCDFLVRTNGTTLKPAPVKDRVVTVNVVLSHMPFEELKMDTGYMNDTVVA